MQFDKTWRRECVGNAARWRYLGAMRDEDFAKVFAVDITGATLGEIAEALAEGFERVVAASEKREASESRDGEEASTWRGAAESEPRAVASSVVGALDRMRRAGRFDLARRLISGKAKKALANLFDALDGCLSGDAGFEKANRGEKTAPGVEALREAFGVVANTNER